MKSLKHSLPTSVNYVALLSVSRVPRLADDLFLEHTRRNKIDRSVVPVRESINRNYILALAKYLVLAVVRKLALIAFSYFACNLLHCIYPYEL